MKIPSFTLLAAVLPLIDFTILASALPVDVAVGHLPSNLPTHPKKVIVVLKSKLSSKKFIKHTSWIRSVHARGLQKRQNANNTIDLPTGIDGTYDINKFKAYAGSFDADTLAEIEHSDDVEYVEEEQEIYIDSTVQSQSHAPWGLSQISNKVSNGRSIEAIGNTDTYRYDESAGEGMYVYVIDTGVFIAHEEFEGRAEHGFTAIPGVDETDEGGHGTHVAGIAVGKTFGVAKKARVIGVKIFADNHSSTTVALEGFNWAIQDIVNKKRQNKAVINMSIGGGVSRAFNEAVDNAFVEGIISVCSAGNNNSQASDQSPASANSSITVGATNRDGTRYHDSNFGSAITLWAPGSVIPSAGIDNVNAMAGYSGTSQAAPHVAGLICYLRGLEGPNGLDARAVRQRLLDAAQKGVLKQDTLMESVNILAYNGVESNGTSVDPKETSVTSESSFQDMLNRGWNWVKGGYEDVKNFVSKMIQ
ncbi:Oryzin [Orbilia brochopaga]|nr:Oryzin [Drechslerella brochopaga]